MPLRTYGAQHAGQRRPAVRPVPPEENRGTAAKGILKIAAENSCTARKACEYGSQPNAIMNLTSTPKTLEAARKFRDGLIERQAAGCPLRFRPVIIAAEESGYYVVELGFAMKNDMTVVR